MANIQKSYNREKFSQRFFSNHSHKKRIDSLETRAVSIEISLVS